MGRGLLLLLLLAACRGPGLPGPVVAAAEVVAGSAEAAVLAELSAFYADFSARDWDAFASHFWEGATLTTVWQPPGAAGPLVDVCDVPGFVRRAPEGPGSQPIFEERLVDAELRVHGNVATAWVRYEARFGAEGALHEWAGIDAWTLVELDGRWKAVAVAWAADG